MKPWPAMMLAGCALPRAEVSPEGTLEIFGPGSLNAGSSLPGEWTIEGGGGQAKRLVSPRPAGLVV